jgi:hypothetical protein
MSEELVRAAIFVGAMLVAAWVTFIVLSLGVSVSAG